MLFFFGYEIRPWIVNKYSEYTHSIDLIVMAITISTILIPIISLIGSGTVPIGSYIIVASLMMIQIQADHL
jgi:hypothetical protein